MQGSSSILAAPIIAGRYRIERMLGEGGTALVVEATDIELGRRVAIKMLRGDAASAPEVTERFRREAQIAAQLPGDHIARVTDVGETGAGEPYLVMELLVGRDLEAEVAARGRLPVHEAVDYLLQACEGVAEAHAAGLVHRDLKPGNLFLTRRRDGTPIVKVLDFGISKGARGTEHAALTTTQANFGTPLYMSPEQIQSTKNVDARCDQHALAAILHTLISGNPPFAAESLTALAVVIATEAPPGLGAFAPPALDAALRRALEKAPSDRYPDLRAFVRAIAPFGSSAAASSVRSVENALAGCPTSSAELASEVSHHSAMAEQEARTLARTAAAQTVPKSNPHPPHLAQTSAGITTSIRRDRVRRASLAAALTGAVLAVCTVAVVVSTRAGRDALGVRESPASVAPGVSRPVDAAENAPMSPPKPVVESDLRAEQPLEPTRTPVAAVVLPKADSTAAPTASARPLRRAAPSEPKRSATPGESKPMEKPLEQQSPTEVFRDR